MAGTVGVTGAPGCCRPRSHWTRSGRCSHQRVSGRNPPGGATCGNSGEVPGGLLQKWGPEQI